MSTGSEPVTIVGAGIAGAACAVVLRDSGIPFRLVDRGLVGGRMASPKLHGRRVDIGAGYFTVRDPEFSAVVARWESVGLARPWTDTFGVLTPDTEPGSSTGPMRWATPGGLGSLVRELLLDVPSESVDLAERPAGDVVLAMPDPQANRLAPVRDPIAYFPSVTVVCGFGTYDLPFENAAFINHHPVLEFLADDGARRDDGAAVLVAHTTASFTRSFLDNSDTAANPDTTTNPGTAPDPRTAIAPTVRALTELVGTPTPSWTYAHLWTSAKPTRAYDATYGSTEYPSGRTYFAGDQWSPHGAPRIESAWRSGTDTGRALVEARRK